MSSLDNAVWAHAVPDDGIGAVLSLWVFEQACNAEILIALD